MKKRLVRVMVAREFFEALLNDFKKPSAVSIKLREYPNAKGEFSVQWATDDSLRGCMWVVLGHPDFPEVPEGELIPEATLVITRHSKC